MDYTALPHVNAFLNATSGVLLLIGFYFISRRRISAHLAMMVAALAVSTLFLISYLIYHYQTGAATPFTGQGVVRYFYYFILITHILLAIIILPLVGFTLWRAFRGEFQRHRRIARWTFPLWLYVSVTGVIVYVMLYQLYPAR